MLPEEKAREIIDRQLKNAGWDVVSRDEYISGSTCAVTEALMQGNKESDYLLFVDDKAIGVVEAKRAENALDADVEAQAEYYATHPQQWYGLWCPDRIPLVYLANGQKIRFKNLLNPDSEYTEISGMHSPKQMLKLIQKTSAYGALPRIEKRGLRDCQYRAISALEQSIKNGKKRHLAVLATGSGKTYLACLASYRLLNYTNQVNRVLFLADRNNLARQAESEFVKFNRTEDQEELGYKYQIARLRKPQDAKAEIVISTIQKLYAVLTGQTLSPDINEDAEDEEIAREEEQEDTGVVQLGSNLQLSPDHFQLIIVDECHRSIYGKWKAVLDYFSGANVLGLTATPTPEAYAYFDENIIEKYTYDDSVVDGVNVPYRIYRIKTNVTEYGGNIQPGSTIEETAKSTGKTLTMQAPKQAMYGAQELDRSVTNQQQIREVLTAYKNAIYTQLYPEREKQWQYIPKTLIFAKDDHHATEITEAVRDVFKTEFENHELPERFVQKITYTAGDTDALIREMRTEKEFRIAVTVTLVATGTDIRPLEVVFFMKDVHSDVLYTQMKGRACRIIGDEALLEVTPNAVTKDCYYIVDAVGVTESPKPMPQPLINSGDRRRVLPLKDLLEQLSHGNLTDENLWLLRDICSSIHRRYEHNNLFGHHLDEFIDLSGFSPRMLANRIQHVFENRELPPFISPSEPNIERKSVVTELISRIDVRKKLLELQRGYYISTDQDPDKLIYAGFSKETARDFISHFEQVLRDNRDSITALRIIYNAEDILITHQMLVELRDRLLAESRQFSVYQIWKNYQILDDSGDVDELDAKSNLNALTHLIQLARYAYGKNRKLTSLITGYSRKFSLYCGQAQRVLTPDQTEVMRQVAEYVIADGALSLSELNDIDTDLWRHGARSFGTLGAWQTEIETMSGFLLKSA